MTIPHDRSAAVRVHRAVPSTGGIDSTLALLAEGYQFLPRRCERLGSDIFTTRIMLRQAVCMRGPEAARLFYTPGRFTRRRAIPPTVLTLLQDFGSVATLDGAAHRRRKALMLSLLGPGHQARMVACAEQAWRARFAEWATRPQVVLLDEAETALADAACRWAGAPLAGAALRLRSEELAAMVDAAGSAGPRNLRAQMLRQRCERWARGVIEAARAGHACDPASPVSVLAHHRDDDGRLLAVKIAAVELINLLRPTLAVARFIVFGALAMHQFPAWRARLATGDDAVLTMFAQEVRRYYPFFPAVGGRVIDAFEWNGLRFERDDWVLFDLYGTNHHPGLWPAPRRFDPERFARWRDDGYSLVAQGAGDYLEGHRCPGEPATVELVKSALHLLASEARYTVPRQDLHIDFRRMPTQPASGMVLEPAR